jgi:hypothetical protein
MSLWTFGWTGDPWPAHVLVLDAVAMLALVALSSRTRIALAPIAAGFRRRNEPFRL